MCTSCVLQYDCITDAIIASNGDIMLQLELSPDLTDEQYCESTHDKYT